MADSRLEKLLDLARERGVMIATAESCTGGLVSARITDIPGSSDVFDRGFVTYSNSAKCDLLGVPMALISDQGAVSDAVVEAMVIGALRHSHAQTAVAITGIAGPGGGSEDKPVGTVWIASALHTAESIDVIRNQYRFEGDREAIRIAASEAAIDMLLLVLQGN